MTLGLCAAYDQFAAEELLVMQFVDCPLRFLDRLHLDEGESFRAFVMLVGHDLGVLHLADTVEEFEEVALGCFEGQVAYLKTRRGHFDGLGLARSSRRAGRTVAR